MNEPTTVARDEQVVRITENKGTGACRSCGNPITWVRTIHGKLMPLEDELRVRALLKRDLQRRVTIQVGSKAGADVVAKDEAHARKLAADGYHVRDQLVDVWEIPASLTHWANCKTARKHRAPRN